MKILLVPNSFKECADSVAIAGLFSLYLSRYDKFKIISKPVSDGGDGFLNVCNQNFGLEIINYKIPAPYKRVPINCPVGYSKKNKKLYIESANVLGLKIIPPHKRHPMQLSSRGMGSLLRNIIKDVEAGKYELKKVVIGIGGTGINDMGIGMLAELGLELLDKNNKLLKPLPLNFDSVDRIKWNKIKLPFKIELVTDVNNPLLGERGASYIYGGQKGLTNSEIKIADSGFKKIIDVSFKQGILKSNSFISGAGGGLTAGFQIFLNANMVLSDKFITGELGIKNSKNFDALITAEGAFDKQSFMNKATGTIIKKYAGSNKKIFLVCGIIDEDVFDDLPANVYPVVMSKFFNSKEDSIKHYKKGIKFACDLIAERLLSILKFNT